MVKKFQNKPYFLMIIFVSGFLWVLTLYNVGTSYSRIAESYLKTEREAFHDHMNGILETYALFSEYIFAQGVNDSPILELLHRAYTADDKEQHVLRNELFELLESTYRLIQDYNFRQLHFHFPDGVSFLRFHSPEFYGDSLLEVRDSIRIANTELRYSQGFEEGRIFNGYRYVQPLFYQDEHIGSVEISTSLASMIEIMNGLDSNLNTFFLMSRSIVEDLVFDEHQGRYMVSSVSPSYVFDREVFELSTRDCECGFLPDISLDELLKLIGEQVKNDLPQQEDFSFILPFGGKQYLIQFISLRNISNQPVGYYFTIGEDLVYTMLRRSAMNQSISLSLIYGIFALLVVFFTRSRRKLAQVAQKADEANKAKSKFLANMSHEIRTPLNGILGFTEMLIGSKLDPVQRQYAENALVSGRLLYDIINDILDLSKIEAGRLELEAIPVFLPQILEEAADVLKFQGEKKNLELLVRIPDDCSLHLLADPTRIKQILVNLLSNGVKFTESGKVELGVECTAVNPREATLKFWVQDTGIGFDISTLESLFEPFHQADSSTTRRYGGSGLGLVICRLLLLKMDSDIQVQSIPGQGSRFDFDLTLPVISKREFDNFSLDSDSSLDTKYAVSSQAGKTPITGAFSILLVEDIQMNIVLMKSFLTRILPEVTLTIAMNGNQAVEATGKNTFDCILMDVQMPELDGIEATKIIRTREKELGIHTPIIALTAGVIQEEKDRCIEAGMDDFLGKPLSLEELRAKLNLILGTDQI